MRWMHSLVMAIALALLPVTIVLSEESTQAHPGDGLQATQENIIYEEIDGVRYAYSTSENGAKILLIETNLIRIDLPEQIGGQIVSGLGVLAEAESSFECEYPTMIKLPSGIKEIDAGAFEPYLGLQAIVDNPQNLSFRSFEGVLYNVVDDRLVCYPPARAGDSYAIPSGIRRIETRAFSGSTLSEVTFSNSIREIGDAAFISCGNLQSVKLPDGLTQIGDHAFASCRSLRTIDIPASVEAIGNGAFESCDSVQNLLLSQVRAEFGTGVFSGCLALEHVALPSAMECLPDETFFNCPTLKAVDWPDRLQTIGRSAFEFCGALTDVALPDTLTTIGASAYASCGELQKVIIPGLIDKVGAGTFAGCVKLSSIDVDRTNLSYRNVEGVLLDVKNKMLHTYPAGKKGYSYEIPLGIKAIEEGAFSGNSIVSVIIVPDSVTEIRSHAFFGCSNAKEIALPQSLLAIGDNAFYSCGQLREIALPSGLTSLGDGAFDGCTSLETVELPALIPSVPARCFNGCTALRSVVLPDTVQRIGEDAFKFCAALEEINWPMALTSIGPSAFDNCALLRKLVLPASVKEIGEGAFYKCVALTEVNLPDIEKLPGSIFAGCEMLREVTIPPSVKVIPFNAFGYCGMLRTVKLPDALQEIGSLAFQYCDGMESIIIPESVTGIAPDAFENCPVLSLQGKEDSYAQRFAEQRGMPFVALWSKSGETAGLVTSIQDEEIIITGYTGEAKQLVIPAILEGLPVTQIAEWAFYGHSSIESVTLPESIRSIGSLAFGYCPELKHISLPKDCVVAGDAFEDSPVEIALQ